MQSKILSIFFFILCNYSILCSQAFFGNSTTHFTFDRVNAFESRRKSPNGALARSIVVPGWGMVYAHNRKGIIAIGEIIGATSLTVSPIMYGINHRKDKGEFIAGLCIAGGVAYYVYQIIYSYNAAIEYNKHNHYTLLNSPLSLNYIPSKQKIVLNVVFRL